MTTVTEAQNFEENSSAPLVPDYEVSEDRSTKSRVTTIIGMFFAMLFAFGGIWMMGQAFEVPEEWGALMFGGGVLVDAFGFWIAFWVVHKIDSEYHVKSSW